MKRFFAILFVSLYLYNIVGYLAVFTFLQYRVRSEVKLMLKSSVPESNLAHFTFHTRELQEGRYKIKWIKSNEFMMDGKLYDVVRTLAVGDSTSFQCINDVQEERLFVDLNEHVRRQMGHSEQPNKLDSFKDVFKDSFAKSAIIVVILPTMEPVSTLAEQHYMSVALEVPFLPPRLST